MIQLKPGVRLHGIRPELVVAIMVADPIWMAAGAPATIVTACIEGQHTDASDHYAGCAIDLRTKNLPAAKLDGVVKDLQAALGEDFYYLVENRGADNEHLHISWRPKQAYKVFA